MKTAKTLFVLGAGASKPFRFPVGADLRLQIISEPKVAWYLRQCGYSETACNQFIEEFKRSGFSIDAFLARRAQFDEIGRVAISAALLPREEDDALYLVDGKPGCSDWYQSLWLKLVGDSTCAAEFRNRQFKSISFNYDRSLERYLHLTAMASFGLLAQDAYELVSDFFPYHVYGQFGDYDHDTIFQREPVHVRAAAENLKVMPSTRPASDEACQALLSWADQVYFVGFSFDPMNCARLGVPETMTTLTRSGRNEPAFYGTGMGLTADEMRAASMLVTGQAERISFVSQPALAAMRLWGPQFD
jgi:hypothetical protein